MCSATPLAQGREVAASASIPVVYTPRPEGTALYECVREHLPRFLARADEQERPVPSFVRKELEGLLHCGKLEEGFVRVRCPSCGFDRLVGFTCKGRALCCSCCGRRMSDTAARLVEQVWPKVPVRQWVETFPVPLRYLLAYDAALMSDVVGICMVEIFRWYRSKAKQEHSLARVCDAHPGAVCVVQRFGSAANLNMHIHVLVADGVYVQDDEGSVKFLTLPEPSRAEVTQVAWSVCSRVVGLLRERGQWIDGEADGLGAEDALAQREPLLSSCSAASLTGTLVMGPRAGQRVMRLYGRAAQDRYETVAADGSSAQATALKNGYGFDLDAKVRVAACDRKRLLGLCRYVLRPALSNDRVARLADGRYTVKLKRPFSDGTTHLLLTGEELLAKLIPLIPPPRQHQVRYCGFLAPHATLRPLVVPAPVEAQVSAQADEADCGGATSSRHRIAWAALMAKVWGIDVLECPRCHEQMQQIATITDPTVIRAILESVRKANAPPSAA
jgi:hypothetical protein